MSDRQITVFYTAIDGAKSVRTFGSLDTARAFAHEWVGPHPEIGSYYAVAGDGVGKVEVKGCSLKELFPEA